MIIQWNSNAAQDTLARMRKAQRGVQECLTQSQKARAALEAANPDGEVKALQKAMERFEICQKRLSKLLDDIEDYQTGVRRAEVCFDEAERSATRTVEDLGRAVSVSTAGGTRVRVRWEPAAYAAAPEMRVRMAPMPSWLEDMTAEASASWL